MYRSYFKHSSEYEIVKFPDTPLGRSVDIRCNLNYEFEIQIPSGISVSDILGWRLDGQQTNHQIYLKFFKMFGGKIFFGTEKLHLHVIQL